MTIPSFARWGVWLGAPPELCEPLGGETKADAIIIGAGFTGLCTALDLREAGADVVLLERSFAGAGASGRNTGLIDGAIANDIPKQELFLGKERARRVSRFTDHAVDALERRIAKHAIDCDFARVGSIVASLHPGQWKMLRARAEQLRAHGSKVELLSSADMRARGLPLTFHEGLIQEDGGSLDPGQYVLGLRRAALAAGVRLFESTPVQSIRPGAEVEVHTPDGVARAPWAVVATNAYTPELDVARRVVVPFRVSGIETEPLTPDQRRRLGWPNAEGVITTHPVLESYRLTARQTLQVSTRRVAYRYGMRLAPEETPETWRLLDRVLRERFPEISDVEVARGWSGYVALTAQFAPVLGVEGAHANLLYGLGYCGHGVATATLMGEILAMQVRGEEHPHAGAVRRDPWRFPPEPITYLGAQSTLGALGLANRLTDRAARRATQQR